MTKDFSLSAASVAENLASGTTVGTFSTIPQVGNTLATRWWRGLAIQTIRTSRSTPAAIFRRLRSSTSKPRAAIRSAFAAPIRGNPTEQVFNVLVANENENPTDIDLSATTFAETQAFGTRWARSALPTRIRGTRLPTPWWLGRAIPTTQASRLMPMATSKQQQLLTSRPRAAIRSECAARIKAD